MRYKYKVEKLDIDIRRKKAITSNAIRTVYFGGERLRRIEIWYDSIGEVHTVRVVYREGNK